MVPESRAGWRAFLVVAAFFALFAIYIAASVIIGREWGSEASNSFVAFTFLGLPVLALIYAAARTFYTILRDEFEDRKDND